MTKKIFDPEKYGMIICPCCSSKGYIQNPKRQCCPKCGGFGFVKKEAEEDTNNLSQNYLLSEVPQSEDKQVGVITFFSALPS